MDIKKILALTIIALALFSCMGAASAGLFDFFGGGGNQTYTFDGFTLDIPSGATVDQSTDSDNGVERKIFKVTSDDKNFTVTISTGNIVGSIDEYVANWEAKGGINEGNYSGWTLINLNKAPITTLQQYNISLNYTGYIMAKHTGTKLIMIRGEDATFLKNLVGTFKEA